MNEQVRILSGAAVGALIGAAAAYLFFTDRGRMMRERLEPAVEDLRHEYARFEKTIEKVRDLATDGLRVLNEFNSARTQYPYGGDRAPH